MWLGRWTVQQLRQHPWVRPGYTPVPGQPARLADLPPPSDIFQERVQLQDLSQVKQEDIAFHLGHASGR